MRDTTRLTRRRWLAASGGAAAAGIAGCLGATARGGDDGGDSGGSDGGGEQTSSGDDSEILQPEDVQGQLDTEETVSEHTVWEYTLEPGETLTATFDGDEYAPARIYKGNSTVIADDDIVTSDDKLAIAQVTAEVTQMYRVDIRPSSPVAAKMYVDSA